MGNNSSIFTTVEPKTGALQMYSKMKSEILTQNRNSKQNAQISDSIWQRSKTRNSDMHVLNIFRDMHV